MTGESYTTTDHEIIRRWTEERNGRPATASAIGSDNGPGVLHIDFGESDESLEEISWQEFFRTFEQMDLAFLYQERTPDGDASRFFKLVQRNNFKKQF